MKITISTNKNKNIEQKAELKKSARFPNFLISLSLFALFFGIPLFFTNITLQGMGFDKMVYFYFWVMIGAGAWVFKGISEGEMNFKKTPLDIPIVVFLAISVLCAIYSKNRVDSFLGAFGIPQKGFLAIFAGAVFYWFLVSNITEKRLKMILRAIIASAGIIGIFIAINFSGLGQLIMSKVSVPESLKFLFDSGFNTVGSMGNLAVFVFVALLLIVGARPLAGALCNKEGGRAQGTAPTWRGRVASCFLLARHLGGFLVSFAYVYLILSLLNYISPYVLLIPLAIFIIFAISKIVSVSRLSTYFSIILFGIILIMFISKLNIRMTKQELPAEVSLSQSASWDVARQALKENWALGTGIGTFEYAYSKYRPQSLNFTALWQTKFSQAGLLTEAIGTMGIAGAVSLAVIMLSFLGLGLTSILNFKFQILKKYQISNNQYQKNDANSVADINNPIFSKLIGLFVSSILLILYVLLSLSSTAIILFAGMIVSLTVAAISLIRIDLFKEYSLTYESSPQYALAMSFIFVCVVSGVVVLFALLGKMYIADVYALSSLQSAQGGSAQGGQASNYDDAAVKMAQAVNLAGYQDEYLARLGNINLNRAVIEMSKVSPSLEGGDRGGSSETNQNADKEKARQLFISALNAHKLALSKAPNDSGVWESFAVAAETAANYDPTLLADVISAYEKTAELNPINPLIFIRLASLKKIMGDAVLEAKKNKESENVELPEAEKIYNEAKDLYNKAIGLRGDLVASYEGLAVIHQRLGEISESVKIYEMLISAAPASESYPYSLAQVYELSQDKENAKKYYQKVIDLVKARENKEGVDEIVKALEGKIGELDNPSAASEISASKGEVAE